MTHKGMLLLELLLSLSLFLLVSTSLIPLIHLFGKLSTTQDQQVRHLNDLHNQFLTDIHTGTPSHTAKVVWITPHIQQWTYPITPHDALQIYVRQP